MTGEDNGISVPARGEHESLYGCCLNEAISGADRTIACAAAASPMLARGGEDVNPATCDEHAARAAEWMSMLLQTEVWRRWGNMVRGRSSVESSTRIGLSTGPALTRTTTTLTHHQQLISFSPCRACHYGVSTGYSQSYLQLPVHGC